MAKRSRHNPLKPVMLRAQQLARDNPGMSLREIRQKLEQEHAWLSKQIRDQLYDGKVWTWISAAREVDETTEFALFNGAVLRDADLSAAEAYRRLAQVMRAVRGGEAAAMMATRMEVKYRKRYGSTFRRSA